MNSPNSSHDFEPAPPPDSTISNETVPSIGWHKAIEAIDTLSTGTVIDGFEELEDVDIFATNLGLHLTTRPPIGSGWRQPVYTLPETHLTTKGRKRYEGWLDRSQAPSQVMAPKNFFGKFKNARAIMLEDTLPYYDDRLAKNFVLFAEMHSTGVGLRGHVAKHCQIGMMVNQQRRQAVPVGITASYRNLGKLSPEDIAETIIEDSSDIARRILVSGLKRAFSAGLPGTGKQR